MEIMVFDAFVLYAVGNGEGFQVEQSLKLELMGL